MAQPQSAVNAAESPQHFYIDSQTSLAELRPRTLKHGDTFALFDRLGDLSPAVGGLEGLYHRDTRFLSRLRLFINDRTPLLLSSTVQNNNAVLDVDLTNPDLARGEKMEVPRDTVHIGRMKFLWNAACYEVLTARNFGEHKHRIRIAFDFDADFVDIFEVRGFVRRESRGEVTVRRHGVDHVRFVYNSLDGVPRATDLLFSPRPTELGAHRAVYDLELGPKQRRTLTVTVHCNMDGARCQRNAAVALRSMRRSVRDSAVGGTRVETSSSVMNEVFHRAVADIKMLVTDTPQGPYPYAGVPWFSTAFGRDGLITAFEVLWIYPDLARGVLGFLAATQATAHDSLNDAEPGKILHETRQGELARLGEVPFGRYYGSVDSTPLFIALAGAYWRQTADRATLDAIWPNVRAALAWIDADGDVDGDGFVEYRRHTERGLANQGWKDSGDAVFYEDGPLAEPPIALCEVQAYVYMARVLGAELADVVGEPELAARQRELAAALRERFDAAFWDEELGTYVLALDGAKRPCRIRSSNAGQVLFSGIARAERAERVARSLMRHESFSGWGLRTVYTSETRFNPASYHNGSIWPHDNALIALGLSRYGYCAESAKLATAILEAASRMDLRRLPELFCGTKRRREKGPVLYPVACAPQAWAAAAPFALLQASLGVEIDAGRRLLSFRHPRLPASFDAMEITGLAVGDARLDLLLRRHRDAVAVNVLERRGKVEIDVRV
jgi:glycogen debranching enzyme